MNRDELFELADKVALGFIRYASDKDIEKFEGFAQLVAEAERNKYEAIITNMAKLLEVQQNREGVAIDMIAAGIAREREACAKVCEETTASWTQYLYNEGCIDCAKAILARGQA